ncbi:MAG: DegT/DnrJ/EryC1/StrS family aminotransferase [Candidatus Omnitrophica bacterium]|nr:DegT/DnrJ/EryC1/StrS family aminotransferase [Candidatus Omnitrophota bacterium]
MAIPMVDLQLHYQRWRHEFETAVLHTLADAHYVFGPQIAELEKTIAAYLKVPHGIAVASGTDALVLSLAALGIGAGDEVLTTPFTFIATAEAISRVGARPVFCDICPQTYNIDPAEIARKYTPRTKAVIIVHLYGCPCALDEIGAFCRSRNIALIEDCAQAFGARYREQPVGSFGICGCLSFFPAKNLGCFGDGGMVVTPDEALARKIQMLRNHGCEQRYFHKIHGFNSRLDTLQAAVLLVKMRYIELTIAERIAHARQYADLLESVPGIRVPVVPPDVRHSFNYYTIRIAAGRRDSVQRRLQEQGIAQAVYYPLSLHLQDVYAELGYRPGDFPQAEQAQREVLSLPLYPELTGAQISEIAAAVKKAVSDGAV